MATATNKRPAPAKSPAQLKAVPKAAAKPAEVEDDDLDDVSEDEGGKPDRLPVTKRAAVRLGNSVNRIIKLAAKIDNWSEDEAGLVKAAQGMLTTGIEALKAACEGIATLPDDYKSRSPRTKAGKGSRSKGELAVGTVVRITDKALPEYEGMEDFDPTGLVTVSPSAPRIWCKTRDGAKALIPRGHLTVDAANGAS